MIFAVSVKVLWMCFAVTERGQCPDQMFACVEHNQAGMTVCFQRKTLMNQRLSSETGPFAFGGWFPITVEPIHLIGAPAAFDQSSVGKTATVDHTVQFHVVFDNFAVAEIDRDLSINLQHSAAKLSCSQSARVKFPHDVIRPSGRRTEAYSASLRPVVMSLVVVHCPVYFTNGEHHHRAGVLTKV
jgi:hypothetical protein